MFRFTTARLGFLASGLAMSLALFSATVIGAPAVQQVWGTFAHKGSVTIGGSGFGTKATAAPIVWDDASGANIRDKWTAAWPSVGNAAYYTTYRNPQRGVSLPHNHITKYIAGAHAESLGADGGYNVVLFKSLPKPEYFYASWYEMTDPAWSYGGDNNYKTFAYSVSTGFSENDFYLQYATSAQGDTANAMTKWATSAPPTFLQNPDANGHNIYWSQSTRKPTASWGKIEVAVKISSGSDGYIQQWENGRRVINYAGTTDTASGTTRAIGIGGYARNYGDPTNWRYYADAYVDSTLSRVVLANNAILANATMIENQIPTAWGSNSIGVTVNLGKLVGGQTAYLFVVDSSGLTNAAGYPVIIGGSEVKPNPPAGVVVQ